MDYIEYLFDGALPENLRMKLYGEWGFKDQRGYRPNLELKKDVFFPDGTPVNYDPDYLYPCYAAWYMGTPIPAEALDVTPGYRRFAAKAAMSWLEKQIPHVTHATMDHHDGEELIVEVNDEDFRFWLPDTSISYMVTVNNYQYPTTVPVILYPDSRDNDEDWEDGFIPSYALQQARMTLWLWRQSREQGRRGPSVDKLFLVRITGNTASDVQVRTVHADEQAEDKLMFRLCRAVSKAKAADKNPLASLNRKPPMSWLERKNEEIEDSYQIDSEDYYKLLHSYMEVRSIRKTYEKQSEEMKAEMDSIAVQLAAMTTPFAKKGTLKVNGISYSVTHQQKRNTGKAPTIPAKLVREFYPELSDAITVNTIPRGSVTIDVM